MDPSTRVLLLLLVAGSLLIGPSAAHPHFKITILTGSQDNNGCKAPECDTSMVSVTFVGSNGKADGPHALSSGEDATGGIGKGEAFTAVFDADVDALGELSSVNITNKSPNGWWM